MGKTVPMAVRIKVKEPNRTERLKLVVRSTVFRLKEVNEILEKGMEKEYREHIVTKLRSLGEKLIDVSKRR